jgi:hypothetical protein
MLRAAAQSSTHTRLTTTLPKAKEDINWHLDKANGVAEQRNTAIHAPMTVAFGKKEITLFPIVFQGNPRARKLVGKDILAEFEWYELSADTLLLFARNISAAINSDNVAWPNRPQMPTLKAKPHAAKNDGASQ